MEKSSESPSTTPPPTSFSSLPNNLVLNCLAHISISHRPIISLVSKSFGSLIASRELYETRSHLGKTEYCLYICLDMNNNNSNPRWFTLSPIPQQQKLLPVPDSSPYQLSKSSSTVVTLGSKIYIIGGYLHADRRGERSRTVLVFDCQSHQWSSLLDMIVPRDRPAAEFIDGKMYVIGGCEDDFEQHWGEVYDPMTHTWEPLSLETLNNLITQKSVAPGKLVMDGKVYEMDGLKLKPEAYFANECKGRYHCFVETETKVRCEIASLGTKLYWRDTNDNESWSDTNDSESWTYVRGLEKLFPKPYYRLGNVREASSGGSRMTVWWKLETYPSQDSDCTKTDIWCAEISFERQGDKELKGIIEWSKSVFNCDGLYFGSNFFLHSALVNH